MTMMHHFQIEADPTNGAWDLTTIEYRGKIDADAHFAQKDTWETHFDVHDGGALDRRFWDLIDEEPTTDNVALTILWKD